MTYKEVEKIRGTPKFIDDINNANQYFQMWTYIKESNTTRLYFGCSTSFLQKRNPQQLHDLLEYYTALT